MLAMIVLGLCLSSCSTTPKPFPKADENSSESVAPAKSNESTEKKKPFPKDFKSLKALAEKGNAKTQSNLGFMYAKGRGVEQNYATAYVWWDIAATNGHASAKKNKGIIAKAIAPDQIAKAGELVKEMVKKNPKLLK